MTSQMLRDAGAAMPGGERAARGLGPAGSIGLSLLMCIPAMLVLLRRLLDPTFALRANWSIGLLGLVAAGAAASTLWSSDRFASAVGAADLVGAVVLMWAVVQCARSWAHVRLLGGVALGLLLVYVAAGLEYRLVDHPELVRRWDQTQRQVTLEDRRWTPTDPAFLDYERKVLSGDLGVDIKRRWNKSQRELFLEQSELSRDEFAFEQYDRKLRSGEVFVFSRSPNTYAGVLLMLGIVVLGAVAQRRADRDSWGWPIAIALGLSGAIAALSYTSSRAAFAIGLLTVAAMALMRWMGPWLSARSRAAYFVVASAIALAGVAVVGHGLLRGHLVEKSLTFRWYYWTGAARLAAQHPLTGVGWENFGRHYTAVRLPQAPEEVKDPHNFILRGAAELGIAGGLLMLAWVARLGWELTRPRAPTEEATAGPRRGLGMLLLLAAGGVVLNAIVCIDFSQVGTGENEGGAMGSGTAFVILELFRRLVAMLLLVVGSAAVAVRSLKDERLDDRPAPWMLTGIVLAAGGFLAQNLIEFSMFEPGPLCILSLMCGVALGVRGGIRPARPRSGAATALGCAAVVWILAAGGLWLPTLHAQSSANRGEDLMARFHESSDRSLAIMASRAFDEAARRQPLDSNLRYQAAWALWAGGAPPATVRAALERAIDADPFCGKYRAALVHFELVQASPDRDRVTQAFEACLRLNPADVQTRLSFAESLQKLGNPSQAARQYRLALEYDGKLPADEPKRLKPARRDEVRRRISDLEPAAAMPSSRASPLAD